MKEKYEVLDGIDAFISIISIWNGMSASWNNFMVSEKVISWVFKSIVNCFKSYVFSTLFGTGSATRVAIWCYYPSGDAPQQNYFETFNSLCVMDKSRNDAQEIMIFIVELESWWNLSLNSWASS